MGMDKGGQDPEAPPEYTLAEGAVGLNEVYRSYRNAGFQRFEALWLVAALIKGVPMPDWLVEKLKED